MYLATVRVPQRHEGVPAFLSPTGGQLCWFWWLWLWWFPIFDINSGTPVLEIVGGNGWDLQPEGSAFMIT